MFYFAKLHHLSLQASILRLIFLKLINFCVFLSFISVNKWEVYTISISYEFQVLFQFFLFLKPINMISYIGKLEAEKVLK